MKTINLDEIKIFVNSNINTFHETRLKCLNDLELKKLLSKNPYLFRAKNINKASDLIENSLDAFLSSSEEKIFGDFLESLAIFVANMTSGGFKSGVSGIDMEIIRENTHYLISIKSGTNWGNAAQHKKLKQDFENATKRIMQIEKSMHVQSMLGICYGKTKTSFLNNYWKLVGQNFWFFISGDKDLYKDIIEPIGYKAQEHNEAFALGKAEIVNRFTKEFLKDFCLDSGRIDWDKLVEYNSGNLDLESFNIR